MKILIIGGTGLISTSITRELLERGDEITLVNRGKTEHRFPGDVKTIVADRNNFDAFEQQMKDVGTFDCVIDMVCYTPEQAESAVRAFKGRIGHFIFCSTVDVYSKPPERFPVMENESRIAASEYGRNKVKCEDIFFLAGERGEFAVTNLRPAHTYSDVGSIVHSFGWSTSLIDRIRRGKPIVVHGDGQALWVSCHADDVGHGFVMACGNSRAYGKAYHLTGEEWQSWDQYHYRVAEAIDAPKPTLVHIPSDILVQLAWQQTLVTYENFQYSNILDNSAAKADLDFHYTVTWNQGVKRTVHWLEEHGRIINSDEEPFYDRVIDKWQAMTAEFVRELKS